MGRHSDLLKAASENDHTRILELFAEKPSSGIRARATSVMKRKRAGAQAAAPVFRTDAGGALQKMGKPKAVKLECRDEDGNTPLILAALGGHVEAVQCFLAYGANPNSTDSKGNTPLQMGAWSSTPRAEEVVEVLLKNGADPNAANAEGYTALHHACQAGKTFVLMMLIDAGADSHATTLGGETPLDVAARFDRRETVSFLIDNDSTVIESTRSLREATMAGKREIAKMLLDFGMDPCDPDGVTGDTALHIAVRFYRADIAELLLGFGADAFAANAKGESAQALVGQYPDAHPHKKKILELIEEYKDKEVTIAAVELDKRETRKAHEVGERLDGPRHPAIEPLADAAWCADTAAHRSASDGAHPPTNLFATSKQLFWTAPGPGRHWVVVDFGGPFTVSRMQLCTRQQKTAPKDFQIETGPSLEGPWRVVHKGEAALACPTGVALDPKTQTWEQEFSGFVGTSRYWRVHLLRNHGATETRVHGVRFFGVEHILKRFFTDHGILQHYDAFVAAGINQIAALKAVTPPRIDALVKLPGHRAKVQLAVDKLRGKRAELHRIVFGTQPPPDAVEGEPLDTFVVQAPPGLVDEVQITVHTDANVRGTLVRPLKPDRQKPSSAVFDDIRISPPGNYLIEASLVASPNVRVKAANGTAVEPPSSRVAIQVLFAPFEHALAFLQE